MPMLLPSLVFWEAFVWERGQAETGITDANILPLIGQNFGCDVDEGTLTFWDHLSCPLVPMHQNELVDPVGCVPLCHGPLLEQLSPQRCRPQFLSSSENSVG